MARELIRSDECSYEIRGDVSEKAATAAALLKKDSFHFRRTDAVSLHGNFETRQPPELTYQSQFSTGCNRHRGAI